MPEQTTLLLVDHDEQQRRKLAAILEFVGYGNLIICDCASVMDKINSENFQTVLIGTCETPKVQQHIFDRIRETKPDVPIIAILDRVEEIPPDHALVRQAFAIINLPVTYTELTDSLHRADVFRAGKSRKGGGFNIDLFRSLVGNSRGIREVRTMIEQVASSEATVLILGESGTGKEVVARNLHYHSSRRDKPFVPINCGAIPSDLLESELFGHEKGAFTGAISAREGRFEMADGGTLFLDEIGDMPKAMQVKLLRVLQEMTFERVGGTKVISTNVRVIAATHRNLDEMIKEEAFREDLYYRLQVFPIDMPPLRDRVDDIPLLINELIARLENEKRGSVRFTPAATMALCRYRWPGNVRELSNLLERLAILHPYDVVDMQDLPEKFRPVGQYEMEPINFEQHLAPMEPLTKTRLPRDGLDLKEHIASIECSLIKQALDETSVSNIT